MPSPHRVGSLLEPFAGNQPAARLIRSTARQQWKLLTLGLVSSLLEAASEGLTFGVIFLAVELLSGSRSQSAVAWASKPLVGLIPGLAALLAGLPTTPLFLGLLSLAVVLQALQSLTRYLGLVSVGYFAARCRALITARIHGQILRLSFPCASAYRVGDLTDYAFQGPEAIRYELETASQIVINVLLCGVYLAVLLTLSPWLLLAAIGLGGLMALVQKRLLPRLRAGAEELSGIEAAIAVRITEDLQNLRLLHSSGQRLEAERRLRQRMGELERSLRRRTRLMNVISPFGAFLPVLAIAVMGALSLLVFGSRTSGVLPSLVTFVLALQRLNMRFSTLAGMLNQLADNSGRIQRLNAILSDEGKTFAREGGVPFAGLRTGIALDHVGLRYAPGEPLALADVSFTIPRGSTVALVGSSGAGKSTIADLLVGLYQPSEGKLLIDGVDLASLDLLSWQQRIGVVSQDTSLFNLSLAENIAFGCPWATETEIREAAHRAHAAEFIERLPEGYATVVGERGFRLSGGQRQRIALARAILRRPDLLILDEATSALDSENEHLVQQAIAELDHSITRLVIAHRLGTVRQADHIVVMDGGRVVEQGSHEQLMALGAGRYRSLWTAQSGDRATGLQPGGRR